MPNAFHESYLLIALLALAIPQPAQAEKAKVKPAAAKLVPALSAKEILDKVSKNVSSSDELATVKMTVIDPSGNKSEKKLEIRRKGSDNDQKVLVKMLSPIDIKGIALLSKSKGKESDQWLFTPSNKQVRRMLSSDKGGSFMGSELSYEDMGGSSDGAFVSKRLGSKNENGKAHFLIENTPKGQSAYGKTVLWVLESSFLVGKIEYFDKAGKPLKVSTFSGYEKFNNTWRAKKIEVSNLQNKRGTMLELSDLKLNGGLADNEFSEGALTEGD